MLQNSTLQENEAQRHEIPSPKPSSYSTDFLCRELGQLGTNEPGDILEAARPLWASPSLARARGSQPCCFPWLHGRQSVPGSHIPPPVRLSKPPSASEPGPRSAVPLISSPLCGCPPSTVAVWVGTWEACPTARTGANTCLSLLVIGTKEVGRLQGTSHHRVSPSAGQHLRGLHPPASFFLSTTCPLAPTAFPCCCWFLFRAFADLEPTITKASVGPGVLACLPPSHLRSVRDWE